MSQDYSANKGPIEDRLARLDAFMTVRLDRVFDG
jgi:hypothetical protein